MFITRQTHGVMPSDHILNKPSKILNYTEDMLPPVDELGVRAASCSKDVFLDSATVLLQIAYTKERTTWSIHYELAYAGHECINRNLNIEKNWDENRV